MGGGSAMFLSASDTGAYKWRGPGRAPDGRRNVEAGIESHPLERLQCRLYAAYDYMKQDDYRPLTYAQAGDLGVYREYDFAPVSSDAPAEAVNYYGYNRQVFADWALLSELRYEFSQETRFVLKPYYERERGAYLDGQASGKVRDWLIAHDSYGLSAELQSRLAGTDLKLGYWWSVLQPPGPPTAWKMYKPDASGGMSFAMWSILAKVETRSQFHNLYLLADHRFDALDLQGGVRVVRETLPGLTEYATMGVGDLSYEEALSASSGPIAARSVGAFSVYQALPFLALDWRLAPRALLKLAAGRNYGAPSFDLWPVYQMNAAGFAARNLSADALWHGIRPETADAVDLGLRLGEADSYLEPTLFYSSNRHKSVAYDPGIGIAYSQNVAHTRAYGAQLAGAWKPLAALSLFGTLSWDRNVFAGDLPRLDGTALAVSGLQLPDTPQWLASAGAEWRWRGLRLAPRMHYSGARYGDTQQTQRLGGYTVVDLDLGYERKLPFGRFDASLSFINLFDRDYIGFINASYYQLLSSSSAIYYPGAPFTVVGRVALNF
jgi:iron complex outermembrane receptor protein